MESRVARECFATRTLEEEKNKSGECVETQNFASRKGSLKLKKKSEEIFLKLGNSVELQLTS